ncbi:type IV secretory system conjugative DNA transfer family protein [Rubrivivax gelatinosus]|uniref:type IV secretory system conjugative DNA transfer family protein n=1 Tax=Rubrivivax gelatinosus TaxID=28068 RepID=UPI001F5B275C|nr:type IV secretory system conjugative DNA transfer family protein [Rubrivivax gelatinosus]
MAALTLYAAGAVFLLLNGADVRQTRPLAYLDYWRRYADDPGLRRKLVLAGTGSGALVFVALPGAVLLATRRRRPLHGAARFANVTEVTRAGLLAEPDSGPAILVGRLGRRYLALPGQLSVMLSAPTRSGKGVGVVIPNLLNWPDSVVVLDIKGENHVVTAGFRAAHGQAVYAFSPFDDRARSHRWNPLSTVRTSPLHRVGDLLEIGQVFFPTDSGHTSSEAFFNDQARNLFLGLGLLLLETPELPRTLGELLRQSSGQGRSLREHLQSTIDARRDAGNPLSGECSDALHRLLGTSENTLSSIVATFNAPLTIFADAIVDAATSADDFLLQDLRRRRMSVYVLVPPHRLASARPLLNLFFSQLVSLNAQTLPEHDPLLRYQCLLVNDEFTAMGRVGILSSAAAFLAGYNVRLLTVVQAMSQLDAVYGDKDARTFATNHGLQILYAPREQRDADEYSAMLGHFTERATSRGRSRSLGMRTQTTLSRNESDQRRALLLPQEFKELGSERLVLILENCKPILADKIRYHREKVFKRRLLAAPAVPALDMDLHFARVQRRVREAPDEIAEGESFSIEQLAQDFSALPPLNANAGHEEIGTLVDTFFNQTRVAAGAGGGEVEPVVCE